jgi:dihydroorotase
MQNHFFISGATLINEGKAWRAELEIKGERILAIHPEGTKPPNGVRSLNYSGKFILPGIIDDQVHFREPGLTHKGNIASESAAAVAGGITSFMEMPNVIPPTLNQRRLEEKLSIADKTSFANYAFFLGASNENILDIQNTDPDLYCGLKIFMGSSTGNMLVDKREVLREVFSIFKGVIALHCEDEEMVKSQTAFYKNQYGEDIPLSLHPIIRSREACYKSSSTAIELATKTGAKIHILHISTAEETHLFSSGKLSNKHFTAEACVHHLWFSDEDYDRLGSKIKWNPAIKKASDRDAIWQAIHDGRIDVVATDHAPHTLEEKSRKYLQCPSGGPLVQHGLLAMAECVHKNKWTLPMLVEKMCHNPALLFKVKERGFIKAGFFADLVALDMNCEYKVTEQNTLYACGWSPFQEQVFHSKVLATWINGHLAWDGTVVNPIKKAQKLIFDKF